MANREFGSKTTADDIVDGISLEGRYIIVTGANTGIGYDTARSLTNAGARVVFACRSLQKSEQAVRQARRQNPACLAEPGVLDLASVRSIRSFVQNLDVPQLDALVCNAGLIAPGYGQTADGLEMTVGVCHYGHFLLTRLLLPRLLQGNASRVVMVASESHRSPRTIDFGKFPLVGSNYKMMLAYGQAKLANVLFANELHRRYASDGMTACSLHPGTLITTDIGRGSMVMRALMSLISPFTKSTNQGAATSVWAVTHEPAADLAGQYLVDCHLGKATIESGDPEAARQLWEISEKWIESLPRAE